MFKSASCISLVVAPIQVIRQYIQAARLAQLFNVLFWQMLYILVHRKATSNIFVCNISSIQFCNVLCLKIYVTTFHGSDMEI